MDKKKRLQETIANSMEDVELSLEQLNFAPGENKYLSEFSHMGERCDFFEELSNACEDE